MTELVMAFAGATIPSIVVGIVLHRMNRKSDERYQQEQAEKREKAEASRLQFELISATADLAYATAMAIKRGTPNGEIENGIQSYDRAKKEYLEYINARYFEHKEGM